MRTRFYLAAAAATLVAAAPAAAQQATVTATGNPIARGVVILPLTLSKTSDLDFGTIVASPTLAGTVSINADDGARAVTGGVVMVPSFPGGRAVFQGAGTPTQNVLLTLQAPAVLNNGSFTIPVNSMTFDTAAPSVLVAGNWTTTRTVDGTGAFQIGVGGVFGIAANQANGVYSAPFIVTAQYQ